ncbi:MAG: hypothetical protein GF331_02345 [Chitinivibrionales bacterium]|nr:hypothetical protein [Chitinivibrionales bacterium]
MKKPSKPQRMPHTSDIAIVHRVAYEISDEACHPALKASLEISLTELLAETDKVEPGKIYVVRGSYTCSGPHVAALRLSAQGHTDSQPFSLALGSGEFEAKAEPLSVTKGMERILDLLAYDSDDNLLGIRMRLTLSTAGATKKTPKRGG